MKRLIAILLCLVMLLSLAACGNDDTQSTDPSTEPSQTTTETTEAQTDETTEPTTEPTDTPTEQPTDPAEDPTDTPDETQPEKKGCKSAIGLTALLTVIGAAWVIRKKRED